MPQALTDAAIRNAKPAAKPVRLFDGGGLYLEVAPAGGKEMADDLKEIYSAPTVEQAEANLISFGKKWDATHPRVSQSWQNNWQRIIPYFAYPPEIRRVIYTTNTIESLNMSLRKVTKNRGSFPNDEAMFEVG